MTDTITYDSRLRPIRLKSYKSRDTYINLTYLYQDNSNVDSIIDSIVTNNRQKYDYDALNRLTTVTCPNGNQSFTYDKVGNRASKSGTNYSYYSSTNKLQQDHRGYKYYYDNSGNILRHRQGSPETTVDSFAYDWNNRLIYYKKISSGVYCDFAYNASGLRIKKHYNDPGSETETTTYYIYDGINPIAEYGPDGTILSRYIYASGMHVAKISGTDTTWYHGDALGSTRKMTKEDGTGYDWSATYYPFGEMTQTGAGNNAHGFTGKEYDSEMGLNYFCLRYYDPQIGRFMTLDPVDQKGISPYAYCFNNPLTSIDPSGSGREDYMTPIRTQQVHAGGGGGVPFGWAPVHHTEEEDLWHDQVMFYWTHKVWGTDWLYELAMSHAEPLDLEFFGPGWDYALDPNRKMSSEKRQLLKEILFYLCSGIVEVDVLTTNGWQHINVGLWIMEHDVNIIDKFLPGLAGETSALDPLTMNLDLNAIAGQANAVIPAYFDLASILLHEAVHLIQFSYGIAPTAYTDAARDAIYNSMERTALGIEALYFSNQWSSGRRADWIKYWQEVNEK